VNLEYERLLIGGVARISARTKPEKAAEGLTQQRLALKLGKTSPDRCAAEVRQAKEEAHQLRTAGRKNDTVAAGIASGSAIRSKVWPHTEHEKSNPLEYHDNPPHRLDPVRLTPVHP
jgi:hypothetical protein